MERMQPDGRVYEFSSGAKAVILEPPPDGMQLARAADEELARYGVPPRPDRAAAPDLHALWHRTFERPLHFVAPEFQESTEELHSGCRASIAAEGNSAYTSNWSGVVAGPLSGDPVNRAVAASWTVPDIVSGDADQDRCAIWVGIDGYWYADARGNYFLPGQGFAPGQVDDTWPFPPTGELSPLLQAGITCLGGGGAFAWWEWIPPGGVNPPVTICSVIPYANKYFETQIWVLSETTANLFMLAGDPYTDAGSVAVLIPIWAPPLTAVWGSSAEWIVERPTMADGSYYTLPAYGTVEFDAAMAWTQSGATLFSGQGTTMIIQGANGENLSVGQKVPPNRATSTVVQCTYGNG